MKTYDVELAAVATIVAADEEDAQLVASSIQAGVYTELGYQSGDPMPLVIVLDITEREGMGG